MATNPDDLVAFQDVRIVKSTAPAMLCRIGDRTVWLPREHISGKLWCTGDRGKLFIRRWVARDRQLFDPAASPLLASVSPSSLRARLHVIRRQPEAEPAK
jgi:hypothetical protein